MGIVDEIRRLIQLGKIEDGLNKLNEWASNNDEDIFNTSILLLSRFNQLKRNSMNGIIDDRDAERSRNRIAFSVLSTLDDISEQEVFIAAPVPPAPNADPAANPANANAPSASKRIFISYAREDRPWVDKLERHLTSLQRRGLVSAWDDSRITAGMEWNASIMTELAKADIYVFMISVDFLASDYIYKHEVPAAMKRYEDDKSIRIVPVILRPCDWSQESYGRFQALPDNALPITKWPDEDEALLSVVNGLARIIQ